MTTTSHTKHILLAVTGASGAVYAKKFIDKIIDLNNCNDIPQSTIELSVIFTQTAKEIFEHETGIQYTDYIKSTTQTSQQVKFIENTNYNFKYASGSNKLDCMIILPCSMGSLARIAQGLSIDLIGRIADVQLKEKRTLIIAPREAPYNLIHLRNMTTLTEAGSIIVPASPSFYNKPNTLEDLIDSFVERILYTAAISQLSPKYKW